MAENTASAHGASPSRDHANGENGSRGAVSGFSAGTPSMGQQTPGGAGRTPVTEGTRGTRSPQRQHQRASTGQRESQYGQGDTSEYGEDMVGDEPWDAEDERLLRNIGDHPLMEQVQQRLQKQLEERYDHVMAELREKKEDAERSEKEREEVGVELYGIQQHLAKLQMQLENAQNNAASVAEFRKKAEEDLKKYQETLEEQRKLVKSEREKLIKLKDELSKVQDTARNVKEYNKGMRDEIALTRRTAYKAEEDAQKIEKEKEQQDFYIDRLNERIERQREKIALYEAQYEAQKEETRVAEETLREAEEEMDKIRFEKKQLFAQWQSSLVGMKRRDEALEKIHTSLQGQHEAFQSLNAEENNTRKAIRQAQEEHAKHQEVYDKEQSQLNWLDQQVSSMRRQFEQLEEEYSVLKSSLDSADGEAQRLRNERTKIERELHELEEKRQKHDQKRQEIENELSANSSEQTTQQKAAKNMAIQAKKTMELIHQKEMEKANIENELASIRVNTLNTEAHNAALRDNLKKLEAEINEKDALVSKYQMEIRQRNDAVEKKMHTVDRLNRKYEKLTAGSNEQENMGPLEANIHHLNKQIQELRKDCDKLQRRWLADQTELVEKSTSNESKNNRLREMNSQYMLLDQKRVRLDGAIEEQRKEVSNLKNGIKNMHDDMARINALIAKNDDLRDKMANSTYTAESEFAEELKELERESFEMDARIASLKEEKADLLKDMEELENQVVMWEKKIKLEKEMQETLDPTEGQSEVQSMEKEIHRMKLRLDTLKRDEQRLVQEMEKAVEKHEDIAKKHWARRNGKVPGGGLTKQGVEKKLNEVPEKLKKQNEKLTRYEAAVEDKKAAVDSIKDETRNEEAEVTRLEEEANEQQRQINTALFEKQKNIDKNTSLQRKINKFSALLEASPKTLSNKHTIESAEENLESANSYRDTVRAMIGELAEEHGELTSVLERVAQLLDM